MGDIDDMSEAELHTMGLGQVIIKPSLVSTFKQFFLDLQGQIKSNFLNSPQKDRPPECIGELTNASYVACVAPICPRAMAALRPVVVPGKHARVEHYRYVYSL